MARALLDPMSTDARAVKPYTYQEFPRMLHKPGGLTFIVTSEDQKVVALEAGWSLVPVSAVAVVAAPEPVEAPVVVAPVRGRRRRQEADE